MDPPTESPPSDPVAPFPPRMRTLYSHEPPPPGPGHVFLQGGFGRQLGAGAGSAADDKLLANICGKTFRRLSGLRELLDSLGHAVPDGGLPIPLDVAAVTVSKLLVTYENYGAAKEVVGAIRRSQLPIGALLPFQPDPTGDCRNTDGDGKKKKGGSNKPVQATTVTASSPIEPGWNRVSPPKFKRGGGDDCVPTRYVYISGMGDSSGYTPDDVREAVSSFESSGRGAEAWCPPGKNHCFVGFRRGADAEAALEGLQGTEPPPPAGAQAGDGVAPSRIFADRARANETAPRRRGVDALPGAPTRAECTSATSSVDVPGLALIENYLSETEGACLSALLSGPQATWAPGQETPSGGRVRRRVQHYGYVFDYATADVLREVGKCPPLPAIAMERRDEMSADELKAHVAECGGGGEGWEALAGIIEGCRRLKSPALPGFDVPNFDCAHINQLTVNEYLPGQGIGSHVDTPSAFDGCLLSLAVEGGCVMEFRRTSGGDGKKGQRKLIYLPPRSLLVLAGAARYDWEHLIVGRASDTVEGKVLPRTRRISVTLRGALAAPRDDGRPPGHLPPLQTSDFPPATTPATGTAAGARADPAATPETERLHVHAVYDAIAEQWHHTRGRRGILWPGAAAFLESLQAGSLVADVGCGDGKYFAACWTHGHFFVGSDISLPLLRTALGGTGGGRDPRQEAYDRSGASARPEVAAADCVNLPLGTGRFDAVLCVAVMHHLSTEERRIRCLSEARRVTRVGGLINVQAWAMEQEEGSKRKFAVADVFVPFAAQPRHLSRVGKGKEGGGGGNVRQPAAAYADAYEGSSLDESKGLVIFQRYCHLYREGELRRLCGLAGGLRVLEEGYESGNYYVVAEVVLM